MIFLIKHQREWSWPLKLSFGFISSEFLHVRCYSHDCLQVVSVGFDNRNLVVGFGHYGEHREKWPRLAKFMRKGMWAWLLFGSTVLSFEARELFPRVPQDDGTSSHSPRGLHNYSDQHCGPFSTWTVLSGAARFPDENCLFCIGLNLVSWILLGMESFSYPWPTFCGTKYPFTVSPSTL